MNGDKIKLECALVEEEVSLFLFIPLFFFERHVLSADISDTRPWPAFHQGETFCDQRSVVNAGESRPVATI